MSSLLSVQLLGDFRLVYGDKPLDTVSTTRLKSLLAYLLLHRNAPQSRHYIAFLFWPDSSESQAHNNLRQSIHRLRQALPDATIFIQSDGQTIQWLPESNFKLDVAEFEQAVEQANSVNLLKEAVRLYKGELLPGCYDDWLLIERERLQQKYHSLLERLIHFLKDLGDYRSAIHFTERLLRSDPLQEELYRQLIRLYSASGDRTGAMRVYHTCVRVFKQELDTGPSPETHAVYVESMKAHIYPILSGQSQKPKNNLPTYLTSFIGRGVDLELLMRIISPRNRTTFKERLVTLTGPGGSGKTRLAIQAAKNLADEFPDGVWLIDVSTLTDSYLISHAVASVLDIKEQSGRETIETIIDHLRSRELLLIFDNCEYFVSSCSQVIDGVLHSCPHIRILTTSQVKLDLPGEKVWPVSPLSLTEDSNSSCGVSSCSDAVRLFIERASSVLPSFAAGVDNVSEIIQICRRLDGLPLAIELAAARVAVLTPVQIASRLDNVFHLLTRESLSVPQRHQTLRAMMDWSYELLTEKERILFRRLSVFSGSFTLQAAEEVCADTATQAGIQTSDILDLLSKLIDKSMVSVSDWSHGNQLRYRLLQPTWQFALEKLQLSDEWEQMRLRHLAFFINIAEMAERHFTGAEQAVWFDQLLAEHDNLMAAIDWSLKHSESTTTLRLLAALWYYWQARGHYKEGLKLLLQTIESTKVLAPTYERAKALWAAGAIFLWSENDLSQARPLLEESLAAGRELGEKRVIAGSLSTLGATALGQGDYAAAKVFLTESALLLHEMGDKHGLGWSYAYLGDLSVFMQNVKRAQEFYEISIGYFREIKDINSLAYPIRRLGVLLMDTGHDKRAISLFEQSMAMNREVNYQKGIAACLVALARVALKQGQLIKAARLTGAAQALLDAVADKLFPTDQSDFDRTVTELRARFEETFIESAWAEGRAMESTEAINYALKTEGT